MNLPKETQPQYYDKRNKDSNTTHNNKFAQESYLKNQNKYKWTLMQKHGNELAKET